MTEPRDVILLAHGDGGLLSRQLLEQYFLPHLTNGLLAGLNDAAVFSVESGRLAITTDSFVVDPIFFPGGDIGKLAVCGTVNDLAVSGARPLYLTAAFIIEEGFPLRDLEKIVRSMAETAQSAGVAIVAGDTKVVGKGQADKLFINTTGVGCIVPGRDLGYHRVGQGCSIIVNGPLGAHGLAILMERETFAFDAPVESDCAPLNLLTERLLAEFRGIRFMRDLTRGGLATNLKELLLASGADGWLEETALPVDDHVRGITNLLGLDPLYLANEGKFLLICDSGDAPRILDYLRTELNQDRAAIIGHIAAGGGDLFLRTAIGGTRRLNMLAGAPLPRIC